MTLKTVEELIDILEHVVKSGKVDVINEALEILYDEQSDYNDKEEEEDEY